VNTTISAPLGRGLLAAALLSCGATMAAEETFKIDSDHTYPSFEFSHMGISVWRGKFNKTSGTVTIDRAAKTGSVEIRVDASSVDFGHRTMNDVALTEEWLNVDRFPVMRYRGPIVFEGETPAAVDGQLSLLAVTKPVRLKINSFACTTHPFYRREVCGADAEGDFNRADFGMKQYREGEKIHLRIQVEGLK
jgi:polyisoprenoid-binding protein YceI